LRRIRWHLLVVRANLIMIDLPHLPHPSHIYTV
jgi:hypothetical protein